MTGEEAFAVRNLAMARMESLLLRCSRILHERKACGQTVIVRAIDHRLLYETNCCLDTLSQEWPFNTPDDMNEKDIHYFEIRMVSLKTGLDIVTDICEDYSVNG